MLSIPVQDIDRDLVIVLAYTTEKSLKMFKLPISFKFLTTFIIVIVLFCSRENNNTSEKTEELTFEVDSTKLELTSYNQDLGIQFNAPKGWTPISHTIFEQFSKRDTVVFIENSDIKIQPKSIFFNEAHKTLLYISQLQKLEDSTWVEKYKGLIQTKFSPVKVGDFLKDDILFTQFLIQDKHLVTFKLLFFNLNNQLIQFDYIIPKDTYLSEIKAIESSIGSIKLIELLSL